MSMTDPIADMLSRIRNANMAGHDTVEIPASRMKVALTKLLREEGFIKHYKVVKVSAKKGEAKSQDRQGLIRIYLKYGPQRERALNGLKRVSRPGLRRYVGWQEIPDVFGGLGIAIMSTPQGVVTGRQARRQRVGGEVLAYIW